MRVASNFNGPDKLEKVSFNNIVAIKINAVFECNSINSSSTKTNLDTIRFLCSYLVPVEEMRQGKRESE